MVKWWEHVRNVRVHRKTMNQYVLYFAVLWTIASFVEYTYHVLWHNESRISERSTWHIRHHNNTQNNMRTDDLTGILSPSTDSFYMSLLLFYVPFTYIYNRNKSPLKLNILVFLTACLLIYHYVIFNCLHSFVHGHDVSKLFPFCPSYESMSIISQNNVFIDYLIKNHYSHHLSKGKNNYNVVFPLTDFLLGTSELHPDSLNYFTEHRNATITVWVAG